MWSDLANTGGERGGGGGGAGQGRWRRGGAGGRAACGGAPRQSGLRGGGARAPGRRAAGATAPGAAPARGAEGPTRQPCACCVTLRDGVVAGGRGRPQIGVGWGRHPPAAAPLTRRKSHRTRPTPRGGGRWQEAWADGLPRGPLPTGGRLLAGAWEGGGGVRASPLCAGRRRAPPPASAWRRVAVCIAGQTVGLRRDFGTAEPERRGGPPRGGGGRQTPVHHPSRWRWRHGTARSGRPRGGVPPCPEAPCPVTVATPSSFFFFFFSLYFRRHLAPPHVAGRAARGKRETHAWIIHDGGEAAPWPLLHGLLSVEPARKASGRPPLSADEQHVLTRGRAGDAPEGPPPSPQADSPLHTVSSTVSQRGCVCSAIGPLSGAALHGPAVCCRKAHTHIVGRLRRGS